MTGIRTWTSAVLLALTVFAPACSAPTRTERYDPGEHVYVLPGADRALDKAIATAERGGPDAEGRGVLLYRPPDP